MGQEPLDGSAQPETEPPLALGGPARGEGPGPPPQPSPTGSQRVGQARRLGNTHVCS